MAYKVFVDTSYLVSLLVDTDSNHKRAINLSKKITGKLYISNYILQELSTVVSRMRGTQFIVEWLNKAYKSEYFEIIYATHPLDLQTIELTRIEANKNISFADYSKIIFMKEYEIDKLLAFDSHFKKLQKYHDFEIIS